MSARILKAPWQPELSQARTVSGASTSKRVTGRVPWRKKRPPRSMQVFKFSYANRTSQTLTALFAGQAQQGRSCGTRIQGPLPAEDHVCLGTSTAPTEQIIAVSITREVHQVYGNGNSISNVASGNYGNSIGNGNTIGNGNPSCNPSAEQCRPCGQQVDDSQVR